MISEIKELGMPQLISIENLLNSKMSVKNIFFKMLIFLSQHAIVADKVGLIIFILNR